MNVWIVNPFDNLPLEGYRPMRFWLMAEAFRRAGHDVVYWTGDFSHANKKKRIFDSKAEMPFNIEMMQTAPYFRNVSVSRLLSHRKLAKTFLTDARRTIRTGRYKAPELIIASSPPLKLVDSAHVLAVETGAKVIVDIMDAWPETFERVVPRFLLWPLRRLARRNYLRAAAITTVADNYVKLVRSYGFSKDIRRFYHGIANGDSPLASMGTVPPHQRGQSPSEQMGTVPVRVVYAGNMGRTYDLKTVVEAVGVLNGAVTLDIAGKGEQEDELRAIVAEKGIKGVVFHGYLAENALSRLLRACDIAIVPMDPGSCVGIPYKFADYAKSSLAIVSSLGGESGRLLMKYGAGESYVYGEKDSLVKALESVMSHLDEMRPASAKMCMENFNAVEIYDAYVKYAVHAVGG